ncbi:MAG: DNA repair protein RadC [Edaphocola sp.]
MEQNKSYSIKQWAEDDRPREKLLQKGYAALSDAELLAILIQSGTREKSAVDLAREVLQLGAQNLSQLGKLSVKDFQKIKGIGEARAITLAAALELGRRRQLGEGLARTKVVGSKAAADILMPLLSDLPNEHFCVLCLSANNSLLHYEIISSGGLMVTVADPKIIFKIALQYSAGNIIIAHNHPSGNVQPSAADRRMTQQIREAGKVLEITLIDHLIIGDKKYFSFVDEGLL